MTLPVAPSSISFNDISLELFCTVQSYNLNDSYGRCVTCLPTPNSTISLSNFYGKTAPLTTLGTCYCGGWYMGCVCANGASYYLLAAPWSGGVICDYFRSGGTPTNTCVCQALPFNTQPCSICDGYYMTKFLQANPNYSPPAPCCSCSPNAWVYPMTNCVNGLATNGYSDWYIPSSSELTTLYCNSDVAWKCGSLMKSTGNQWPTAIICACNSPIFAGAPGCLPYLGYTAGCNGCANAILPMSIGSGLTGGGCVFSSCGLILTGNPQPSGPGIYNCMMALTAANTACPTITPFGFSSSVGLMCNRLQCTPGSACIAAYPQPYCFTSQQRYAIRATRAVRRQAF